MDETIEIDTAIISKRTFAVDGEILKIKLKNSESTRSDGAKNTHVAEQNREKYHTDDNTSNETKKLQITNLDVLQSNEIKHRKMIVCKYFKKNGECKFGKRCDFLHATINKKTDVKALSTEFMKNAEALSLNVQAGNDDSFGLSDTNEMVDNPEDNDLKITSSKSKACKFFITRMGCRSGDTCPFKHYRSVSDAGNGEINLKNELLQVNTPPGVTVVIKEEDLELACKVEDIETQRISKKNDILQSDIVEVNPKPVCKYIRSKKGCLKKDCPFNHQTSNSQTASINNNKTAQTEDNVKNRTEGFCGKDRSEILCKYETNGKQCKNSNCSYLHNKSKNFSTNKTHNKDTKEIDETAENKSIQNNKKEKINCRNFNKSSGCKNKKCPFLHEINKAILCPEGNLNYVTPNFGAKDVVSTENNTQKSSLAELNKIKTTNKLPKAQTMCKFYLEEKRCRSKRPCPYLHVQSQEFSNDNNENAGKIDRDAKNLDRDAKNLESGNDARNGSCKSFQQNRPDSNMEILRQREFIQLEKRFKPENRFKILQDDPERIYLVTVKPTDPDWEFVIKEFILKLIFPPSYPQEMFHIELQEDVSFPPFFCLYFNMILLEWTKDRSETRDNQDLAFRPFLRWFDKSLKDIFTKSATMVKLRLDAKRSGITLVHHQDILANNTNHSSDTVNQPENSTVYDTANDPKLNVEDTKDMMVMHNKVLNDDKVAQAQALSPKVKKGTEIKFINLALGEEVGTVKLQSILLTVCCNRCKNRTDIHLQEKRFSSSLCKKCNSQLRITYYSQLIHQYSPIVGYLHLEGCKPFDLVLLDSILILNCLSCSKDTIVKGVAYGKRDTWCHSCHTKMLINVQATKFVILQHDGSANKPLEQAAKKKKIRDVGIRDGEPLLNYGTCKHYKKSFRWFRFPCCGKAYPCDTCHEEKEDGDHELKFATRMICGYCAKEQPFSKDKPCVRCNSDVTRSKSSHWNGGKGCRDKTKMARDDRQKTAGLGKTISRKKVGDSTKKHK